MSHLLHPVLDTKMLVWYADFVPLRRLVIMRIVAVWHIYGYVIPATIKGEDYTIII